MSADLDTLKRAALDAAADVDELRVKLDAAQRAYDLAVAAVVEAEAEASGLKRWRIVFRSEPVDDLRTWRAQGEKQQERIIRATDGSNVVNLHWESDVDPTDDDFTLALRHSLALHKAKVGR